MKILYYDCFSGISGDMNLGAMIDIGIDKDFLADELNKLNLKGWEMIVNRDQRHGIGGTRVSIRQTRHEHAHRHLEDVEEIIGGTSLDDSVKKLSLKIFMKVAEAEAKVHGIPVEEVHFHEVGAVDSIIDIVGAAICYNALKVDRVYVSVVELGGGMVQCDHGKLPVPAPATVEILKGIPVRTGGVDFEATTPTGAAIIAALGTDFNTREPLRLGKTGYGVGQKDHHNVPNLLRVSLGESDTDIHTGHDALLIECNIDDMNPEIYEYLTEKLFRAGASDVFCTSLIMKKGRPGTGLHVICEESSADSIREIIFSESTSIGIRTIPFRKDTLIRKLETVKSKYGDIRLKRSFFKGREVSCKPEYEDCKRIAAEKGIPIKEVYNNLIANLLLKTENKYD